MPRGKGTKIKKQHYGLSKEKKLESRKITIGVITERLEEIHAKAAVLEDIMCRSNEEELTNDEWGQLDEMTGKIANAHLEFRRIREDLNKV